MYGSIYILIYLLLFLSKYIYNIYYHNTTIVYARIFSIVYFHPDFPFYFSSAISMLQPQAEHHLTKGGLRGTHTTNLNQDL